MTRAAAVETSKRFSYVGLDVGVNKKIPDLSNYFKGGWRRRWDSNPRNGSPFAQLATECFRPLSHASDNLCLAGPDGLGKRAC